MLNKRYTKNEVENLFRDSTNELIKKSLKYNTTKLYDPECTHYMEHYNKELKHLVGEKIKVLEIGVKDGESLKLWKDYFGFFSKIHGVELNPEPLKNFKEKDIEIFFGDQTDVPFLLDVAKNGPYDIIIDDGGHTMSQLKTSFEVLFKYGLKDGGTYIMEDLGTSYWSNWSGGLNNKESIINYLKNKVDSINHRFYKGNRTHYIGIPEYSTIDTDYFDENITGIKFFKGMCFIDKGDNKYEG